MKHKLGSIKNSIILKFTALIFLIAISIVVLLFVFAAVFFTDPTAIQSHKLLFGGLIVIVIIIFFVALIVMHHYLSPIIQLSNGVSEIRKGNLDHKIPVKSKDELGQLADAFNKMTTDIKQMIQAKEQLLYDVSHELRTPLTNSKLALEMLPDSDEKKSIIEDVCEVETMINELLESARMNSSTFELDVKKLNVKGLITNTILRYFKDVDRIKVSPISSELTIQVDEQRIVTVLKNLIDNSLKYSLGKDIPIEIDVINRNNELIIQIEDSGAGIPEEKLPYIFEPFYRTDNSRAKKTGGYGLGLHLCKRIMDVHNATLKIFNKTSESGIVAQMIFTKANG
ncbi:MAG: HAMP domain-containing histidine kinase [Bacteroidetes bacterium]|nr:HAMP domain-containing histidine kinase [Bacteroidota bacterium]